MQDLEALRAACLRCVERAGPEDWTYHGFGMIRTYLDDDHRFRLNVWHSSLLVPGVSTVHNHPWHFRSRVLLGELFNRRYVELPRDDSNKGQLYSASRVRTGEGGGLVGDAGELRLLPRALERYTAGDEYSQTADEIHETTYADGTVTINDRRRLAEDGHHATVYYPLGTPWVDAAPRFPTDAEINVVISAVLRK